MLFSLSIFALEPCAVPQFKVRVLSKKDRHHSKVAPLGNVIRC